MATYARREITIWKKNKTKLDQWLRLIFPKRFPHPYQYSCGISYEYLPGWPELNEREIIRLCLCHTIFINFKVMYHKLKKCLNSRSSHQSCSVEKAVLKNLAIFTGKHLCWSLLWIDFGLQDLQTGVFLWILRNF